MTNLIAVVAAAGERLVTASGSRIAFDASQALSRAADLDLSPPGIWSPNRHCRLVPCIDGWIAVSLARPDDEAAVPAWLREPVSGDPRLAIERAAQKRPAAAMVTDAQWLHLPVALVGETQPSEPTPLAAGGRRDGPVIDLSALWAGPYCGGLLAAAGLEVVKIESPDRPDPTPQHTPALDARINGRKQRLAMEFGSPELLERLVGARILITSARPHALARHGINEAQLFAANPGLLWIAITAHGWHGDAGLRVGFGDDCAAAGGLLGWRDDTPEFLGDALADPLTGLAAATQALTALGTGRAGLIDVALAATAASFARTIA